MDTVSLLQQLAAKDIQLWLENGQLRFSAPEGAMTDTLLQQIKAEKPNIIEFLQQASAAATPALEIPVIARGMQLPLSSAQQRLWFIHQLEPDSDAYHIHGALMLEGELQIDKLQRSIDDLVQRQESLRSHIQLVQGQPQIVVLEHLPLSIQHYDQASLEQTAFLQQQLSEPFDLLQGPLIRIALLKQSENRHILSVCMHHIISDGWSMGLLLQELISLYTMGAQSLHELALQYIDYAAWQQSEAYRDQAAREAAYWQQQLADVPILSLPFDSYDQENNQHEQHDGIVSLSISSQQSTALALLAKQQQASLFMVLISLYASLLHKLTGQLDFAIGTPIAGRSNPALEHIIGCFINTQAIRIELSPEDSFIKLLHRLKQTCSDALNHQQMPFEEIVRAQGLKPQADISPIFQTLFVFQNTPLTTSHVEGLSATPLPALEQDAQFPLALHASETEDGIALQFRYQNRYFQASSVDRLADYFSRIVAQVTEQASTTVGQLRLINQQQQDFWLRSYSKQNPAIEEQPQGFNQTETSFAALAAASDAGAVVELIERQIDLTPNNIAISIDDQQLSYRQLEQQANQLARLLKHEGFAGKLIAVHMPRCIELSITLLAIHKVGACYLPLDIDLPASRLAYILEDAAASVLISKALSHQSADNRSQINTALADCPLAIRHFSWSSDEHSLDQPLSAQIQQQQTARLDIAAHSLFAVIYTSGSTGTPKGVKITQQGILNRLLWMQSSYPLNDSDVVLQKTPYSFDVSIWELFWPLLSGARLCFAKPDGHKDSHYLYTLIQQQSVTCLHFVPSMFGQFLALDDLEQLLSIKQIFTSGEALQIEQLKQWQSKLPQCQLSNLYGPTEASIDVSAYDCQRDKSYLTVPIGKPIANTQLYVLNQQLQLQPPGIAGELYIGGIGLASGYINLPEQTAAAFIDNPFEQSQQVSPKLYKTGDLVRLNAENQLEYLGRLDHQVKLRGLRIELGEIEHAIISQADYQEVIVNVIDEVLVAHILVSDIEAAKANEKLLKQALAKSLPAYMLPHQFNYLLQWPLTPNGKVNRRSLKKPVIDRPKQQIIAPENAIQQELLSIWQTVLGVEAISIDDNFFELGGHSLNATQAFTLTQEKFAVSLPLREIFNNPTITAIAEMVEQQQLANAVFAESNSTDSSNDDEIESFTL